MKYDALTASIVPVMSANCYGFWEINDKGMLKVIVQLSENKKNSLAALEELGFVYSNGMETIISGFLPYNNISKAVFLPQISKIRPLYTLSGGLVNCPDI